MKLLLLPCILLLAACATKDTAEPPTELTDFSAEARIKQIWSINTGNSNAYADIKLQPYFDSDAIYTAAYNGQLTHFSKADGKQQWLKKTTDLISSGITGNDSKLFYGTKNGDLVAIDKASAKELWRVALKSEILVNPVSALGLVIARTIDGNIQAFASNSGEKRWSYKMTVPALSLHGNSQPIVIDSQVLLIGSDNGRLIALNINNGRILFETPLALPSGSNPIARLADIDMTPTYDGNLLYISAYQNGFSAVDLKQGRIVWQNKASTYQPVSYDSDKIYLTDNHSQIWALNRISGDVIWVQKGLRARKVSGPTLYKNQIIVADYEGFLHVLSRTDGRFIARKATDKSGYLSKPLLSPGEENIFYHVTKNGQFAAYEIAANQITAK